MPGSRVPSPWRSRWLRHCAGPLKWREKLSLKLRRQAALARPPAESGAAAAPARAREFPSPAAIESKASRGRNASPQQTGSEKSQESVVAEAWGSNTRQCRQPKRPALRRGQRTRRRGSQASDAGGSKKILLVAVVLLGIAAAGYFGWTKMQSGHPQPAPQSIAPANSGTASLPPTALLRPQRLNPQRTEVVRPAGGGLGQRPAGTASSSKPSAAIVAEAPGVKTPPAPNPRRRLKSGGRGEGTGCRQQTGHGAGSKEWSSTQPKMKPRLRNQSRRRPQPALRPVRTTRRSLVWWTQTRSMPKSTPSRP